MAPVPVKALVLLNLSVLLLSSFSALGDDLSVSAFVQAPHWAPVGAPKPHKGHHPHPHPHPHPPAKAPMPPPPAKTPVSPPAKAPSSKPLSPPPPAKSPTPPPAKAPTPPPAKAPTPPPAKAPTPPPTPTPAPSRMLVAVQGVVYCKTCKFRGIDTLVGASPLAGALVRMRCNNTKYRLVQDATTDKNGYFFMMPPKSLTTAGAHKCRVFLVTSPVAKCSFPTNLHGGRTGAPLVATPKPPVSGAKAPKFQLYTVGPLAFEPPKKQC